MPMVQDILATKGNQVHTVAPGATALEAIKRMNQHKIGALLVMEEGQVVGIFTERDVLRRVVGMERSPAIVFKISCSRRAMGSPLKCSFS